MPSPVMMCPVNGCSQSIYSRGFGLRGHLQSHVNKGHITLEQRHEIEDKFDPATRTAIARAIRRRKGERD